MTILFWHKQMMKANVVRPLQPLLSSCAPECLAAAQVTAIEVQWLQQINMLVVQG
jgi:hypothetical protein